MISRANDYIFMDGDISRNLILPEIWNKETVGLILNFCFKGSLEHKYKKGK